MRHFLLSTFVLGVIAAGCTPSPSNPPSASARADWAIAIHGGAGHFGEEDLSPDMQEAYTASLESALQLGEDLLQQGSSAVDVVEQVVRILEDDSLFNAGRRRIHLRRHT